VLLAAAAPALAEEARDHVKAEVVAPAAGAPVATAGSEVVLAVRLDIEEGWHVYGPGDPAGQATILRVSLAGGDLEVGAFAPDEKPTPHADFPGDEPRLEYRGSVTYRAKVRVPAGAAAGTYRIVGEAQVDACDEGHCLPTGTVPFEAAIVVGAAGELVPAPPAAKPGPGPGGGPPGASARPPGAPPPSAGEEKRPEGGIDGAFLLAAVVAGLLTIATPCVFPMIPLTVSLLTKRAQAQPGRILPNAVAYGAGMFLSIAGIGLAMSLLFGVAPTDLALSPAFNVAIFLFLGALALSLFGAFDLQLPAFLTNWSQARAGAGGGTGLFFMGMTLAFTSFACAAPFAGVLVVEARESVGKGLVGMGVYAATFTAPFFVTALFPGLLTRLPRSGGWLNAVKVVMGFFEVAAAFKFLRGADMAWGWEVFSFELVLAIWIACALGAFLYLLGFVVLPHETRLETLGVARLLWALLFLSTALFMVPGLFGRTLPPYLESFIIRESTDEDWIRNDLPKALEEAREYGKPVLVDFTGFF